MPDNSPHQINLLDFLAFLLRWRRFLIVSVVGVAIVVGIISFVVKPSYRSTAVIHSSEHQSEGFGGLLASKISALAGFAGAAPIFGETPSEMYVQILRSRWMSEKLINAFDLRKVYRMTDAPIEQVIEAARAQTRFELDPTSLSLTISTMDTDPKRSQAITQFLVDELDKRNQELRSESARREKEFVSARLDEARTKLVSLEDSLTRYQLTTGVLNASEQIKATLGAAAQLEAQRLALKTELEMNSQIFSPQNPEVSFLRLKMASLDSTIQSLSKGRDHADESSDVLMHLQDTPSEAIAYIRLTRDIEVQQLLVEFLVQQYEQAKIEEQRNTPTIMRIDPPVVATMKAWPRRSLMVAIGTFAALIFSIAFALTFEFFHRAATDPSHPQYHHLSGVRKAWNAKQSQTH
jgi:tyrosine-protein kinase Etk/Wzc